MSNINLLPWRQELRERARKAYLSKLAIFAFIGIVAASLWYGYEQLSIEAQNKRNSQLTEHIQKVDQQIAEISKLKEYIQQLKDRMNAITTLQQSRNIPVHLFSDLPTLVASGIYLNAMKLDNNRIDVKGLAEANPRLSSMLRNIDNSKWLGNASIVQTKAEVKDGKKVIPTLPDGLYEFQMGFNVDANQQQASNAKGGRK